MITVWNTTKINLCNKFILFKVLWSSFKNIFSEFFHYFYQKLKNSWKVKSALLVVWKQIKHNIKGHQSQSLHKIITSSRKDIFINISVFQILIMWTTIFSNRGSTCFSNGICSGMYVISHWKKQLEQHKKYEVKQQSSTNLVFNQKHFHKKCMALPHAKDRIKIILVP